MSSIMRSINIVSRCAAMYRADSLCDSELTACHHAYVLSICHHPGISQEQLARHICLNKSNVTRTLAYLEEHGFVNRKQSETDKRVSRKIVKAAKQNNNLKDVVNRNVGTIRALNPSAHKGYQKWHRNFDNAVVSWLQKNPNATASQFTGFMNKLYSSQAGFSRFGSVQFIP